MIDQTDELRQLLDACSASVEAREDAQVVDLRDGADLWVSEHTGSRAATLLHTALGQLVSLGASDLHVKAGSRPWLRVDGQLRMAPMFVLDDADCAALVHAALPARQVAAFDRDGEADFALDMGGFGRFRVNAFRERGRCGMAIRRIATVVPDADTLGLLPAVRALADRRTGLVVIGGRVGAGKSTTLAWMVDRINRTRAANVVTVEDPIEFLHADVRSIVHQREVGVDTASHAEGVRRALRQDPDVVVIGEIRDEDTAEAALGAAQTGHLVLATVHADTAPDTVDRLVDLFPGARQHQARLSLAACLQAVVGQRLVARSRDGGRVLVQEVAVATSRLAGRIVEPAAPGPSLAELIAADEYLGMISFDQHLAALCADGVLGRDDALAAATNPHDLALRLDR